MRQRFRLKEGPIGGTQVFNEQIVILLQCDLTMQSRDFFVVNG